MLVIGCTVSLMSWGRGRCTQPTPRECCVLPVQPVWNWEHWGGGRHCDWARRAPHRVLSPRGARWGHQCACTTERLSRAGTDRRPRRAGWAWQTPQVFELLELTQPAAGLPGMALTAQQEPFSLWRAVQGLSAVLEELYSAKVLCRTQSNSRRCHWYLLDSSYQFQAHNYILQHKIHYCSWINCSLGCRMPLCTVQPSLCLQIQGQSRCIC